MTTKKKSILLVDHDPESCRRLFFALVRAGHSVTDTFSADYAFQILTDRSFDVAIVDVLTSKDGHRDLIGELRNDWSLPLIIAMADFESVAIRKSLAKRGAHHFIQKPVDVAKPIALVSPEPVFSGSVEGVDILEYLQFMLLTGKRTVVRIQDRRGQMCHIYFKDGNVVHAECTDVHGEDAFFRALSMEGGSFSNMPWQEPDWITIDKPGEFLLLEAARKRDEGR